MLNSTIGYTLGLVAFIALIMLYDKGFSFKNSLIISLFIPFLGGIFIALGLFTLTLLLILMLFGTIIYLLNKKKLMKLKSKNFRFKIYRI